MILLMFAGKILITPWYASVLGTLGVALIILALMLCHRSSWSAMSINPPSNSFPCTLATGDLTAVFLPGRGMLC
jgi:hypothetical protein